MVNLTEKYQRKSRCNLFLKKYVERHDCEKSEVSRHCSTVSILHAAANRSMTFSNQISSDMT